MSFLGYVLWEGPSAFDGAPIVLIANSFRRQKEYVNSKTGDAIQTWILRRDVDPFDALKRGEDSSVCGSCKLRPQGQDGSQRACFVHIGHVHNIWRAYREGRYRIIRRLELLDYEFEGRILRIGSYGDPSSVPIEIWKRLIKMVRAHVGYTHEWAETKDPEWKEILMASVDSPEEHRLAVADGWRTFRTRFAYEELSEDEAICPASAEGGHRSHCVDCRLCDGMHSSSDRRKSVAIINHGWSAARSAYEKTRLRILTPAEVKEHEEKALEYTKAMMAAYAKERDERSRQ